MPALWKSRARSWRTDRRHRRLGLQPLEERRLLAVDTQFNNGLLTIESDLSSFIHLGSNDGLVEVNRVAPSSGPIAAAAVTAVHVTAGEYTHVIAASELDSSDFPSVEHLVLSNGPWVDPTETVSVINETLGNGWAEKLGIQTKLGYLFSGDWKTPLADGRLAAQLTEAGWGNAQALLEQIVYEVETRAVIRSVSVASAADFGVNLLFDGRLKSSSPQSPPAPGAPYSSGLGDGDEGDPELNAGNASVTEPADPQNTVNLVFPIGLDDGDDHDGVTANWTLVDTTATHPSDYSGPTSGTVSFAAGVTTEYITVSVNGDDVYENSETFQILLSSIQGADSGDTTGTGTIHNAADDLPPEITITSSPINEPATAGQAADLVFTVALSEASGAPVTFDWATADQLAGAPGDYDAVLPESKTIAAGATQLLLTVVVRGDSIYDPNETFSVNLTNVVGAADTEYSADGSIVNTDAAPVPLYWDPTESGGTSLGGTGDWLGTNNWWDGDNNVTWTIGNEAIFEGTAGTVTLDAAVTAYSVEFGSDNYVLTGNDLTLVGRSTPLTADESATINSSIIIDAGQEWDIASGEVLAIGGVISGRGTLAKTGAGTLTLSDANTYTGDTEIRDGTFELGIANALPTDTVITFGTASTDGSLELNGFDQQVGGLIVASGATAANQVIGNSSTTADAILTFNAATGSTSSFAGTIQDKVTGSGTHTTALTVANGDLTLTAANTFTGGTVVTGGTLLLSGGDDRLATTGDITVSGGTLDLGNNSQASSATISFQGGTVQNGTLVSTVSDYDGQSGTVSAVLSGGVGLDKTTGGTLSLLSTNTYTGGTTIAAGVVGFGTGGLTASGTITVSGDATLRWESNTEDISDRSTVNSGVNATFDTNGNNVTFATGLGGTGSLTKTGSGDLTLTAANTFTGGTIVDAGTLQLSGGDDRLATTGDVTVTVGGILDLGGNTQTTSGAVSFQGGIVFNGTLDKSGAAYDGQSGSVSAVLTGNVGLSKSGTSTLVLLGANTYTENTTINAGTLWFDNGGLATSGDISVVGDATLRWFNGNTEDISSRLDVNANQTATLDVGNNNVTFGTFVSIFGSFTKAGSGTLTLTNTFVNNSGTATVAAGTLKIGDGGSTGSLLFANVVNDASLVFDHSDSFSFAKPISGTGTVTQLGSGMLSLTDQVNSYTGGTILQSGTLQFDQGGLGSSGNISVSADATLRWFTGNTEDISSRLVIANGVNATLDTNSNDVVFATGFGGGGSGAVTKIGFGTLTLAAANSYTGTTTVTTGSLELTSANAIVGGVTLNNGADLPFVAGGLGTSGTITVNGSSTLEWTGTNTDDISDRLVLGNSIDVTLDLGSNDVTLATAFGGNSSAEIIKQGTGTLTLNGVNRYTGGTQVFGGTVVFDTGGLAAQGDINLKGDATLRWAGGNTEDISDRLKVDSGVLATLDIGGNDVTFGSFIFIFGSITKVGSGTLTVTNQITGSGTLTIDVGTVKVGDGGAAATNPLDFPQIVNNTKLVFHHDNLSIIDDEISGTGSIEMIGTGELLLDNLNNSYTGGTDVYSGILQVKDNGLATIGNITFHDEATLKWWHFASLGSTTDISSRLVINNGVTITLDTNSNDVTLASSIGNSGSGSVIKTGIGTLTFEAVNTYTGTTTVNNGTVIYDQAVTLTGAGTMTADVEAEVHFKNGLTFASDGALILNDSAEAHFIGDSTVSGDGEIRLTDENATLFSRSVDGLAQATLTIGAAATVRGIGSIAEYHTLIEDLVNQGTIIAEDNALGNTLTIALPYSNEATFAATKLGRLDRNGSELHGNRSAVSGRELLFFWSHVDITAPPTTYSVEISTDGGQNYSSMGTGSSNIETFLFGDLDRNTPYDMRMVASYSDGSEEIYYSGNTSTLDMADMSGWYRVDVQPDDVFANDFYALYPSFDANRPGVYANSPQGAILRSLPDLAKDATVPTPEASDGQMAIYDGSHDDRFSFVNDNGQSPEGALSTPLRFALHTEPLDGAPNAELSEDPVRYFDGAVDFSTTDVQSDGLGETFSQSRSWIASDKLSADQHNGTGWINNSIARLAQANAGESISVIRSAMDIETFELSGGNYTPTSYSPETLEHDGVTDEFVWADTQGNEIRFYDFGTSTPAGREGTFKSMTSPGGLLTEVTAWTVDGDIAEIRRQDAGSTEVESWLNTYLQAPDVNAGLLDSVQLRQTDGGGGWDVVRTVEYDYYDGTTSHGNLGDLKSATIKDAGGNVLDTDYYRYYKSGDPAGYKHGLKYVFDEMSYARVVADLGDVDLLGDAQVAPYAQHYFEYDATRRATRHDIQRFGAEADDGIGTFTYQYFSNSNYSTDPNDWIYKTIETLPDGNTNTMYTNIGGALLLKDFEDVDDPINPTLEGEHWLTYFEYDSAGRLALEAEPSAVVSYLIDGSNDLVVTLAATAGLIHLTEYYATTTATDTTAGGVESYVKQTKVKQGDTGTPILQSFKDYYLKTDSGRANVVVASDTVYSDTAGLDAETTSFSYTWFSGSVAVESMEMSLPIVATTENGSGVADTTTMFNDVYGRPIWVEDADGYLTYTEYDDVTGVVVKTIADVDTSQTSDFADLPSGWSTPTGGGLHLITTIEFDALGRPTKLTDPVGNVTHTVYDDVEHEIRAYPGWDTTTDNTTGPIVVYREDHAGGYSETLTFQWDDAGGLPVDGGGAPAGSESLSDSKAVIQSLSRTLLNSANQVIATRDYTSLDGVTYSTARNLGTQGTHYLETLAAYADVGRMATIVDASGTSHHVFYDGPGRLAQEWTGTDDVPTTDYNSDSVIDREDFRWWVEQNPTSLVGPAGTSMYKSTLNVYDDGNAGGDSNLTEVNDYFGSGSGEFYTTHHEYDWRNRQTAMLEPDDVATSFTLDNLGRITDIHVYGSSSYTAGAIVSGDLRAQTKSLYDKQGRVYESRTYEVTVTPGTGAGTAGDYLPTDYWYDPRGYLAKSVIGEGAFAKFSYDGVGRLAASYASYDSSESQTDYSAAMSVTGDTVIEQTQSWYDGNGREIAAATYRRLPDDTTSSGALAADDGYVDVLATWYDAAQRITHQVDYGRQDAIAGTATDFFDAAGALIDSDSSGVPDVVEATAPEPNTSDNYLVTKTVYDPQLSGDGAIVDATDNLGRTTRVEHDLLGRTIRTISNYVDGTVAETDTDSDVTIEYEYDSFGRLATLTAKNAKGTGNGIVNQETRYLYESADNALLTTAEVSPDSIDVLSQDTSGVWSFTTDNDDHTETAYDWLNRPTSMTDQRGVVHDYSYDSAGRLAADTASNLGLGGQNVDDAIRRIGYGYDDLGRPQSVTSYSDTAGTTEVNEIEYAYDGWGNLVEEWQAHDGEVNTSTSESVQYTYDDGAVSGVAKYLRLTNVIYPNARDVVYGYGTAGSTDDVLSRIESIGDDTDNHAVYDYLGVDWIVTEDYEEPEVKLDYTGSNFAALDRFGRLADQVWEYYGTTPSTLDEYNYTYDRMGNRTARDNALASALDQDFGYDDLDQLISADRDNGNGVTQDWELDALGNWSSFDDDGTVRTRGVNEANEITSTTNLATPTYDRAGNMVSTPKPGDPTNDWDVTYDAWNRVVEVTDATTTVDYEYDGQNRRIERDDGTTEEHFFYDGGQVVETQVPDGQSGFETDKQYVWSLRYVDSPILRDSYSGGVLQTADRLYYLTDANHNVTAVTNNAGVVQERYDYDAYGTVTIYDVNWANPTTTSAVGNTLFFAGQDVDVATALQYSRARWYSSVVGGFISRDPIGEYNRSHGTELGINGGSPALVYTAFADGPNAYIYGHSSPTNETDPMGLAGWLSGFLDSLGDSYQSMTETYAALILEHYYGLPDEAARMMEDAYRRGPLGQTEDSCGLAYYGTRGALGVATVATAAATVSIITGFSPWLGKIAVHGPHHGMGNHLQFMLRTGAHTTRHLRIPLP